MANWQKTKDFLLKYSTLLWVYIIITTVASVHLFSLGTTHEFAGRMYTEYNNYLIFKNSFFHLIDGKDLYILYPDEQWDLYKYGPAFALCMGAIAWLPDIAGLTLWNLANVLLLFYAVKMLPFRQSTIALMLWFVLLELLTSVQSAQSNAMMAGLMIAAYAWLQRGKPIWATFMLVAATFIKVYGAVGFCLFLFYPNKVKFLVWAAIWTIIFTFIPLVVTSPQVLMDQYVSWARMMTEDQALSYGFSLMGVLHTWFGLGSLKNVVSVLGMLLFFLPMLKAKMYRNDMFRILTLAHILVWVIIFNHKAESSTFIIAISGVALWYFANNKAGWRMALLWFTFVFTCLSPTDLFPPVVRQQFLVPYFIKVVPCIVLWVVIIWQILTLRPGARIANISH
jgi:Protein of unknown function (DUF2029).